MRIGHGVEQEVAWIVLKQQLMQQPILAQPSFEKEFILYTDWSAIGLGAVLAQVGDG